MATKKESDPYALNYFFYITFAIIVLLLCLFNLQKNKAVETKVLGIQTKSDDLNIFWTKFLDLHPDYLPGLEEVGNLEKIQQLDPNYFK